VAKALLHCSTTNRMPTLHIEAYQLDEVPWALAQTWPRLSFSLVRAVFPSALHGLLDLHFTCVICETTNGDCGLTHPACVTTQGLEFENRNMSNTWYYCTTHAHNHGCQSRCVCLRLAAYVYAPYVWHYSLHIRLSGPPPVSSAWRVSTTPTATHPGEQKVAAHEHVFRVRAHCLARHPFPFHRRSHVTVSSA
jgi:hypothetical protein